MAPDPATIITRLPPAIFPAQFSSLRRRLSIAALLLAWLCANGAVWNVVQFVAWAKMYQDYSRVMPVSQALQLTFDGEAPCDLCTLSQDAQDTARSQLPREADLGGGVDKILLICDLAPVPVMVAPGVSWPGLRPEAGLTRDEAVPVRPPRV